MMTVAGRVKAHTSAPAMIAVVLQPIWSAAKLSAGNMAAAPAITAVLMTARAKALRCSNHWLTTVIRLGKIPRPRPTEAATA